MFCLTGGNTVGSKVAETVMWLKQRALIKFLFAEGEELT
jgi:hypothetical protein